MDISKRDELAKDLENAKNTIDIVEDNIYNYFQQETKTICEKYKLNYHSAYTTMFYTKGTIDDHTQFFGVEGYIKELEYPEEYQVLEQWLHFQGLEVPVFKIKLQNNKVDTNESS